MSIPGFRKPPRVAPARGSTPEGNSAGGACQGALQGELTREAAWSGEADDAG